MFRANAFALPGGIIVITDDMVKTAETPEEVLAVLAHEIGHVELRHTVRSVLQNSILAAAVAAVTSDAASLSAVVAGLPMLVAQTKYSREFETAADDYAFRLLKRKEHSPAAFASIMERIAKREGDKPGAFAYVSTHPDTTERVKRARNAAAQ
jgi:predicted Zn-dependent protease